MINEIDPNIQVLAFELEITDETAVKTLFEQIKSKVETVDVLVNNAGVWKSAHQSIADGDIDLLWRDIVG